MRAVILFITTALLPALLLASNPATVSGSAEPRTVSDALCYRTFSPVEYASPAPVSLASIPLKWTATFTNTNAAKVNHMLVTFSDNIDAIESCSPFNRAVRVTDQKNTWDLSGATVSRGAVITVRGASKVQKVSVLSWKWLYDLRLATRVKGNLNFAVTLAGSLMPTPANVISELYQPGAAQQSMSTARVVNTDGIILGIPRPDSAKFYSWVRLKNTLHVNFTLQARPGYVHTGLPRGLEAASSGIRLSGELAYLPPTRHDNVLVASLLALKLNVLASSRGITPAGLANLVFHDNTNPYSGWNVNRIIRRADTLLTYWQGHSRTEYAALEYAMEKINHAFCGPIDTLSVSPSMVLTGVANPEAASFLGMPLLPPPVNQHVEPAPAPSPAPVTAAVAEPKSFSLGQNYPNPFNPSTVIPFTISEPAAVRLTVYNMIGQEVAVLIDGASMDAGEHQVTFQAGGFASGTYLYRLTVQPVSGAKPFSSIKKMSIIQ